jgi:putative ABC transport system permease protein
MFGLGTVVFLVFVVVALVRGLETSLAVSGDPLVVLVHSLGASENIENSTIPGQGAGVLSASLSRMKAAIARSPCRPSFTLGRRSRPSR